MLPSFILLNPRFPRDCESSIHRNLLAGHGCIFRQRDVCVRAVVKICLDVVERRFPRRYIESVYFVLQNSFALLLGDFFVGKLAALKS